MKIKATSNVYTSCCANESYHMLDHWGGDILAYGACHMIALYSIENKRVVNSLRGHSGIVNSVRFIDKNGRFLISSSRDNSAIVWSRNSDADQTTYDALYVLKHPTAVLLADSIAVGEKILSVTISQDRRLRIWLNDENILEESASSYFIYDFKIRENLQLLPGIVLFSAGSNQKILVQSFDLDTRTLSDITSLSGHTDWIRTLDIHENPADGAVMIASGSQDFTIRVYRIFEIKSQESQQQLHMQMIQGQSRPLMSELATILFSHEHWVTCVKWFPATENLSRPNLWSTSTDRTMILWEEMGESEENSVWNEKTRLGDVGGVNGFLGCVADPVHNFVVGYNHRGALEFWAPDATGTGEWRQNFSVTGHFDEVTDLTWESQGKFFLTCSADKTTRLHARWIQGSWAEIGRVQAHGHPLKCIALANSIKLVSGADEKVIRIFQATKHFLHSFENICGEELSAKIDDSELAEYATVPALGLSNSAVFQNSSTNTEANGGDQIPNQLKDSFKQDAQNSSFTPKVLATPPVEETLEQNTLWPEVRKLYGHGYELFALATNPSGTLLASACKAQSAKNAVIILWDLETNELVAKLSAHNLTVTQLKFSTDGRMLLSMSRDRTWNLFDVDRAPERFGQRLAFFASKTGGHTRIIWDAAWTSDSRSFVTVGRDCKAILWDVNGEATVANAHVLALEDSVTSVDVLGTHQSFLAVFGQENGRLSLHRFDREAGWTLLDNLNKYWHSSVVNRVRFSPKFQESDDGKITQLSIATCSNDRFVKLIQVDIES